MRAPTPAGQALVDSFDSIRIINLVDRADRRREMSAEFARLGLSLDHPKIAIFPAQRFTDPAGFPTAGTRGCFDSHLSVLREAAKQGVESVLILEDDFNFHDEIDVLLPPVLEQLAQGDWEIVFGSLLPGQYDAHTGPIELLDIQTGVCGAHFYAVRGPAIEATARYLEAMLDRPADGQHPDGQAMHYDGAISVFRSRHPAIRTYVAYPDLGHQRISRTDIHALLFYDRIAMFRPAAALGRKLIRMAGRTRPLRR